MIWKTDIFKYGKVNIFENGVVSYGCRGYYLLQLSSRLYRMALHKALKTISVVIGHISSLFYLLVFCIFLFSLHVAM